MTIFRHYYLYFLDRELLSTLGLYGKLPLASVQYNTLMCLLSTPFQSYCSLSLVFESNYANAIYLDLLPVFQGGHIVLSMSGAKSLFTWIEEKRRQYKYSDKERYFRYMDDNWERIAETVPAIHYRKIDTTQDLSVALSDYVSLAQYKELITKENDVIVTQETAAVSGPILDAIQERGERAITKELFRDTYQEYDVSVKARRIFDLSVSIQYVASQIKEFAATVPVNGQLPIHEFDELSTNYPLSDLRIWETMYKQLGLYHDLGQLSAQDITLFRESDVFEPLLSRISGAMALVDRVKPSLGAETLQGHIRSAKKTALSRVIDKSKKLLSTEWPYDYLSKERTRYMARFPDPKKVLVIPGREGNQEHFKKPKIFISYAREDLDKALELHKNLERSDCDPWIDKKNLLPGAKWKIAIQRAIRTSDFFLACLSRKSVSKTGFFQTELKEGYEILKQYPSEGIYFIPVRFEDCDVPEELKDYTWLDLFEKDGFTLLLRGIQEERTRRFGVQREYSIGITVDDIAKKIEFPQKEAWDFDRDGMVFPAIVDGKEIRCLISKEALEDHFGADISVSPEKGFQLNRHYIEDVAKRLIQKTVFEPTGEVFIRSEDLH